MNASTDCDGMEMLVVFTAPPPYWKVAALITAIAPLWMPTLPHIPIVRVGVVVSPVTLIGSGTSGVVACVVEDRGEQDLRVAGGLVDKAGRQRIVPIVGVEASDVGA